jgi:RNA polymerase sigma-70 factor (ECF subfamily)
MIPSARVSDDAETAIKTALERGDHDRATTLTLEAYAPEILGLLVALHRSHDAASEAFSVFSERLWTTMPRFEGKCSMRTWAYVLARRAGYDLMRAEKPRKQKNVPLSQVPEISALVDRVRTQTLSLLAEEKVSAFTALRRELPEEDQMLLVLRVDRDLPWDDLARIFLDEKREPSPEGLKREAARLRKRFQLVKERLRTLGQERGLIRARE